MGFLFRVGVERRREILSVILLAATTLLFLALVTDSLQGSSKRLMSDYSQYPNILGQPGAAVASFLYILLGQAAHVLYFLFAVWGLMLIRHTPLDRFPARLVGLLFVVGAVAGLLHLNSDPGALTGGMVGVFVGQRIFGSFGAIGANVVGVTFTLVGVLLATEFLFVKMALTARELAVLVVRSAILLIRQWHAYHSMRSAQRAARQPREAAPLEPRAIEPRAGARRERAEATLPQDRNINIRDRAREVEEPFAPVPEPQQLTIPTPPDDAAFELDLDEGQPAQGGPEPAQEARPPRVRAEAPKSSRVPRRKSAEPEELPDGYVYPKTYTPPRLDLFEEAGYVAPVDLTDQLRQTSALLEETLQTFGIEARVTDVTRGPTITRYELEPAPGIKVSRFLSLADDLALALKAHRVRVEAPIPGKGRVGIEVPNKDREPVVIRDLLESKAYGKSRARLPLALGKDIAGDVSVADLTTMPHLLVAGATGAGKTVCVKSLLASLLFHHKPEELQLMLIDPKMVELSIFNDIPHLMTPVVIDPKKAAMALNWLISEMEERYTLFAHLRVRNIEVYNQSVENGEIEMEAGDDGEGASLSVIRKLPYIVCVIDELADLMMLARAEVEDAIARLAQLARAVGIHLVIATQRPSVDVLTGVIKANFPARMSFQVSSRVDSRCILDEIGAERLIGQGDMLYLPAGQSKPTRIQGAFVSDEEMNRLVAYLKTQAPPQYRDEIEKFGQKKEAQVDLADDHDDLFDDAVRIVLETGQASISMVQRRLRVGYTRAARLIDMMEVKGIVGPHTGSKAREILVGLREEDEVA
jgi:DNA segregation ATPase FtsK/SpoIIIE, S-DNA-T family